jgi:hypothetical protein
MRPVLLCLFLVSGAPVTAATIILDGPPAIGPSTRLLPSDFVGYGTSGSGLSVVSDGRSWMVNPSTAAAFGRYDPRGGDVIDSQDRRATVWTYARPDSAAFDTLSFALTDARDQRNSYFAIAAGGAKTAIRQREANGTLHWVTIQLPEAVRSLRVKFATRLNDGFGLASATGVCR